MGTNVAKSSTRSPVLKPPAAQLIYPPTLSSPSPTTNYHGATAAAHDAGLGPNLTPPSTCIARSTRNVVAAANSCDPPPLRKCDSSS